MPKLHKKPNLLQHLPLLEQSREKGAWSRPQNCDCGGEEGVGVLWVWGESWGAVPGLLWGVFVPWVCEEGGQAGPLPWEGACLDTSVLKFIYSHLLYILCSAIFQSSIIPKFFQQYLAIKTNYTFSMTPNSQSLNFHPIQIFSKFTPNQKYLNSATIRSPRS
jgi:hypothetical protein